jgi:hypothetical protein
MMTLPFLRATTVVTPVALRSGASVTAKPRARAATATTPLGSLVADGSGLAVPVGDALGEPLGEPLGSELGEPVGSGVGQFAIHTGTFTVPPWSAPG